MSTSKSSSSSSLEGFYNEIKADPANEKKYFTTIYLDDWDRKLTRIVKPVVNWPDASRKWVGDPVAFVSVQVGYPSTEGDIQWAPHVFQSTDTGDATQWTARMAKKNAGDVSNAPAGWTPDKVFVKRMIHLTEPPGETDSPYMRVFVEKNTIDLDPGDDGTMTTENTLEVRADSAGKLELGPIALNVTLADGQIVEVEFQADGRTDDGNPRSVTRFSWDSTNQTELRYWEIFTGQPAFVPNFKYRVHVLVKGTIFNKGQEWYGPWIDAGGNGPFMVSVPRPTDGGVVVKDIIRPPFGAQAPVSAPVTTGLGAPPGNGRLPAGIGAPGAAGVGAPKGIAAGSPVSGKGVGRSSHGDYSTSGYNLAPEVATATKAVPRRDRAPARERLWQLDLLPEGRTSDPGSDGAGG